jgi:hypothetical protein
LVRILVADTAIVTGFEVTVNGINTATRLSELCAKNQRKDARSPGRKDQELKTLRL